MLSLCIDGLDIAVELADKSSSLLIIHIIFFIVTFGDLLT